MLRGQRVGLRHVTEEDLPWLKRTTGDPQIRGPFMGTRMMTPHTVEQRWKDNGFSGEDAERLLICHLVDGSVIGDVVHFAAARYTTAREIGWTMADIAMRGQGLAQVLSLPAAQPQAAAQPVSEVAAAGPGGLWLVRPWPVVGLSMTLASGCE